MKLLGDLTLPVDAIGNQATTQQQLNSTTMDVPGPGLQTRMWTVYNNSQPSIPSKAWTDLAWPNTATAECYCPEGTPMTGLAFRPPASLYGVWMLTVTFMWNAMVSPRAGIRIQDGNNLTRFQDMRPDCYANNICFIGWLDTLSPLGTTIKAQVYNDSAAAVIGFTQGIRAQFMFLGDTS